MSLWQIHERGRDGKIWRLTRDKKVTVGRNEDSHIQVASQTVESNHAVLEWSGREEAFVIRDLGSVNGTWVDNRPLRGGQLVLRHGHSIRFGYDKSRIFRIEETQAPPPDSTSSLEPSITTAFSVTTQTSPQAPRLPVQTTPSGVIQKPIPVAGVYAYNVPPTQPHPFPHPVPLPPMQSPIHYVVTQPPVQYGYHPPSPTFSMSPHIQHIPPGHVYPNATPPMGMITPRSSSSLPTTPTTSCTLSVEDLEVESVLEGGVLEGGEKSHNRSDGRRSVEISQSPSLSKTSKLYGQPSWWGEEPEGSGDEQGGGPHKLECVKPGTQILRDLDSRRSHDDDQGCTTKGVRLSAKDELRMQAITNSITHDRDPGSSWVIDFGGSDSLGRRKTFHHRPRSADPSPSRSPNVRDVSPASSTPSSRRSISPATRRMTVSPSVSPRHSRTTILRKKEAEAKSSASSSGTKKPPSGGNVNRSKTVRKTTPTAKTIQRRHSSEGLNAKVKSPASTSVSEKKKKKKKDLEGSGKVENQNETYVTASQASIESHSSISDQSVTLELDKVNTVASSEDQKENGRPSSARKQWSNKQPQAPDSLMLASIEARMRRLSRIAQAAARQVTSLKRELLEVGGVVQQDPASFEHISTSPTPKENLPEWKFFHKEVDSIFRSMRSSERWLKDIHNTVNSIKPVGGATEEGVASEAVDYEGTEYDSDQELFQDSMEDLLSYSENEDSVV